MIRNKTVPKTVSWGTPASIGREEVHIDNSALTVQVEEVRKPDEWPCMLRAALYDAGSQPGNQSRMLND